MNPALGLGSMPAEILLEIFGWVCQDEIELGMLGLSKRIRSVLLSHPTVLALGAFSVHTNEKGARLLSNSVQYQAQLQTLQPRLLCPARTATVDEIVQRPWCKGSTLSQLQMALTRRLIRVHWVPYLRRDGRLRQAGRLSELLGQVTLLLQQAEQDHEEMCTMADTLVEYPWTHLQIYPSQARVYIRDKLSNTCEELNIPVVSLIEAARTTTIVKGP